MLLGAKWMFVDVARGLAATDCIADSRSKLIEKAKKMYNKTDAEIRGWAKQGSEPGMVEFRLVTEVRKPKKATTLHPKSKKVASIRRKISSPRYALEQGRGVVHP